MTAALQTVAGRPMLVAAADGEPIRYRQAVDLIGEAMGAGAAWVVLPARRLGPDFFRLATGIAGEVIQKFVTYERRLVILGDIAAHLAESAALRDFVRESNRGSHVWFVEDLAALEGRLSDAKP